MPVPSETSVVAHIDGASRGNPGPAAYAVVVESIDGDRLAAISKFLGKTTNNVAEYQALLAALAYALENRCTLVKVFSDSELLVRQIQGVYKVKSPDLKPLHNQALRMIQQIPAFSIKHIPREQNAEADRLANQTLDATPAGSKPSTAPGSRIAPTSAVHRRGTLDPCGRLSLDEGEEVDFEIRRKP